MSCSKTAALPPASACSVQLTLPSSQICFSKFARHDIHSIVLAFVVLVDRPSNFDCGHKNLPLILREGGGPICESPAKYGVKAAKKAAKLSSRAKVSG